MYKVKEIILILKKSATLSCFLPLKERLEKEGIFLQFFLTGDAPHKQETLYITDCGRTALKLKEQGLPVLGFLHEDAERFSGIDYVMESPDGVDADYLDRVYRRYLDIPWDILETERCILRETTVADVDSFFQIYSHPDITKYTEKLNSTKELETAYIREYIDKVYRYFEFGVWTVLWKETGEVIGRAGFSVREGYDLPELGYVIGVPWQGKGIAYEICCAILQYGREEYEFDRVQTLVMPENAASLALCRKLGFVEKMRVSEKSQEYILLVKEL